MLIHGTNIDIKLVGVSDAQALLALQVKNKDFFQVFSGKRDEHFYTYQGQVDRILNTLESQKNGTRYLFLIQSRNTGELIGEVMLYKVVRENLESCGIGYTLDQDQNGKGYMTEAVKLVVNYAFTELKLHRIEAGVMPHNTGSIKVMQKAGFTQEGLARKNVNINGRWEDHLTFAILEEDVIGQI
ncbi:GNAT family N-acetyltransferase [Paenibacillus terrigena]|uniref:GNAT family N-acetyltransferase n=1 Tax=Paenibacillus terrigena TaxID=369333 RepID=UPI000375C64E|nr:GNAT family protein [Paenibacillus terrigena]